MRRRQMKKQKRIIIISSLCLLLCLCVGYAAFNTQLSITAKGNIKEMPNCEMGGIKVNTVTDGDGLYKDIYEEERCVYRGQDPDNYIMFNDELWRIVAKESDGTYKIIRNELLPQNSGYTPMAFDENNHRSTQKNSYCDYPLNGCGVFAAVSGEFSNPSGSKRGTVTEDSSIKAYLNGTYYSSLSGTAKNQMTSHSFNIGAVDYLDESGSAADSISENIAGEKMYTWSGNVGFANVSDILKASTNSLCKSATDQYYQLIDSGTSTCNSNYLLGLPDNTGFWTINAFGSESGSFYRPSDSAFAWYAAVNEGLSGLGNGFARIDDLAGARPVVFLKSTITLDGQGTISEPYTIN